MAPPTPLAPPIALSPLPLQLHLLSGTNSGRKMATAGSRTSSSGLLDSNEYANVPSGPQGGCSAPCLPSSQVKSNAVENAQWRRKELRKVKSVDLEKADALHHHLHHISTESGASPIAAQLHYLSVSSPLCQQSRHHVQHSNSLTQHPLLDKVNSANSLSTGAQELPQTSCSLSTDHAAPSVDLSSVQHR